MGNAEKKKKKKQKKHIAECPGSKQEMNTFLSVAYLVYILSSIFFPLSTYFFSTSSCVFPLFMLYLQRAMVEKFFATFALYMA